MLNETELPTREQPLSDDDVVAEVKEGRTELFEILMRRYNQRLYRVTVAILQNDGEAEDVMQDTFVRAYQHLDQFAGKAKFSTWLTKIAVHEALARKRHSSRFEELNSMSITSEDPMERFVSDMPSPEQQTSNAELRALLESAVTRLPQVYRLVFMLRDVEELSTTDVAYALAISEDNVKVRLHRAHALLRKNLLAMAGMQAKDAFCFNAVRCDRVVLNVLSRIANGSPRDGAS